MELKYIRVSIWGSHYRSSEYGFVETDIQVKIRGQGGHCL